MIFRRIGHLKLFRIRDLKNTAIRFLLNLANIFQKLREISSISRPAYLESPCSWVFR